MSDKDDTPRLPHFVEGVLSLFEGFKGHEVVFRCVTRNNSAQCVHCGELTPNRLEIIKAGELLSLSIACRTCLKGAGEAASHDTE